MSVLNTIEYDIASNEFLVNGNSLLRHFEKHENVDSKNHIPSVISQPGASDRFLGKEEPDLEGEHVALYLCSHCGGYDGNPIGVKLEFKEDTVYWKEIGFYSDFQEGINEPFQKVREYIFPIKMYKELFERTKIYEP